MTVSIDRDQMLRIKRVLEGAAEIIGVRVVSSSVNIQTDKIEMRIASRADAERVESLLRVLGLSGSKDICLLVPNGK